MTEFSRLSLWGFISLSLGVTACQNETPAFTEQNLAAIAISVSDKGSESDDRNVYSMDAETSSVADDASAEDVPGYAADDSSEGEGEAGDPSGEGSHPNRHSSDQETEAGSASPQASANSPASSPSPAPSYGVSSDDSQAIAKECSKHFKGIASKIIVLSAGDSVSSLSLSPDTVLAIRMTGQQPSLNLALAAGQPLAGLCVVMRGHEPSLQLSSGAPVKKMVYLASGDESRGEIQFSSGLNGSTIDLSGHSPQLHLRGVDSSVCDSARLRNHSAKIQCSR